MLKINMHEEDQEKQYEQLLNQFSALIEGEHDTIANLSNASALLNQFLDQINWVGFYLLKQGELVLGPFQGLPACIRIELGKGVCGTAAAKRHSIIVDDVTKFPGHIFCDAASKSEVVVPIIKGHQVIGVLDIDSPVLNRFDETDQFYLEKFVHILEGSL